jgi:carbamoyltransferase
MFTLGISFDYHDSAAALLRDGIVVAAAEEERFSRRKHDSSFPRRAVQFCLDQAGITVADIDAAVYYEKTYLKLDRIIDSFLAMPEGSADRLNGLIDVWMRHRKFDVVDRIGAIGIPRDRIFSVAHHVSHAASAFFCSPFERATVITMDGAGEYDALTISEGDGTSLRCLHGQRLPDSLGLLYSAFTAFLGFEVNEGEYKLMGMAGFGQPRFAEQIRELVSLSPQGGFSIDQDYFEFLCPGEVPYSPRFTQVFGPARRPESPFDPRDDACRHYADIAASIQLVTEEIILHVVEGAVKRTGNTDVCIAGGVGLNSMANARIVRDLGYGLYVHPAAGDSGGALGAALMHYHRQPQALRAPPLVDVYLGAAQSESDIVAAFDRFRPRLVTVMPDDVALVNEVARLLVEGGVVGWSQGRFEWGPRALGNRSILADPRSVDMQLIVNTKIKYREPFRPFAPAVLADSAHEYFQIPHEIGPSSPEMFMLAVARVRPEKIGMIPAVTHVDGTARVQVVSESSNPLFYRLIRRFADLTGVPILLNTSFNLRGEAMSANTYDAMDTFYWSEMDAVAIGRYLLRKGAR